MHCNTNGKIQTAKKFQKEKQNKTQLVKNDRFLLESCCFQQLKRLPTSLFVIHVLNIHTHWIRVWWYCSLRARFRRPPEREIPSVIDIEAKVIPHHRPLLDYLGGAVIEWNSQRLRALHSDRVKCVAGNKQSVGPKNNSKTKTKRNFNPYIMALCTIIEYGKSMRRLWQEVED